MLSPDLLDLLWEYWREARPEGWLFPGKPKINPVTSRQLGRAFNSAKHLAGISKPATLHTLRHSFATHLLEAGTDVRVIYYPAVAECSDERQVLLGRAKLSMTARYTKGATKTIRDGGACRRPAPGRVFPCRLHPASRDCPDRLLEQEGRLWPAVQCVGGNGNNHRRRSQAAWCAGWYDQCAAYLGVHRP